MGYQLPEDPLLDPVDKDSMAALLNRQTRMSKEILQLRRILLLYELEAFKHNQKALVNRKADETMVELSVIKKQYSPSEHCNESGILERRKLKREER